MKLQHQNRDAAPQWMQVDQQRNFAAALGSPGHGVGPNKVPTAFEELLGEYEKRGERFQILTHPYFSTGAFPFKQVFSHADANGFQRMVFQCPRGTKVELFSYAIDDTGTGANLGTPGGGGRGP